MNVDELLKFHLAFTFEAYTLCASKNHDYAGADGGAPFRNFEAVEALGIASTEAGFLVRMTDKLNRLVTFVNDGKLVLENEGAMDSLLDLINYSVLLAAYMQHRSHGFPSLSEPPHHREDKGGPAPEKTG